MVGKDGDYYLNDYVESPDIALDPGEFVKRPTSKVLDADGVEIKVGDDGWSVLTGVKLDSVIGFHDDGFGMKVELEDGFWIEPFIFTHEKPVFDADGVRICKGDTVWYKNCDEYNVELVSKIDGRILISNQYYQHWSDAKDLTHQEPDSLEKLRDDIKEYNEKGAYKLSELEEFADRLTALIERGA